MGTMNWRKVPSNWAADLTNERSEQMIKWIDIVETNPKDPEYARTSSLEASNPEQLTVTGNLPHGYTFRPKTAADRDALIEWLNALTFTGAQS